jgi:5-methylcytosine-specific restriction endonuclease McrA
MVETKSCRPGGHNPPATEEFFYRNKRKGTLRGHCKSCRRAASLGWHEANRERHLASMNAYAGEHREENKQRCLTHYRANRETYYARVHERRALKTKAFVERVFRSVVFQRDEGVCGICDKPVEPDDWHLDHIVPLSKGGEHSYANVQVAHPFCNMAKGDKIGFVVDELKEVS